MDRFSENDWMAMVATARKGSCSAELADSGATRSRELRPTGTEGAVVPIRKPAIAAVAGERKGKPGPIPLNVAFREIVNFVVTELNASGEQWSENSRQDLVSTVMIAAQKGGLLTVWERGEVA